ncbi:MAG: RHS repeat-associated core domain-containing protein, partial [Acidobacteriota bacterium]|nr:RHS repeat-associated core domain-containing protein [Acidobacteriota bacterium]
ITTGTEATAILGVDVATNRIDKSGVESTSAQMANMVASYDAGGNLTSYHPDSFQFDALNVMTKSNVGGKWRSNVYTASDERIATIELTGATGSETRSDWTIRDTSGKVLRRFSRESGVWQWNEDYVYRGEQMLASDIPGPVKRYQYHLDHLGTPRLITGNGGARISQHTYYPFGRETATTANATDGERKQFTGHERDRGSLDYMHARYYNPYAGRFLSVDRAPGKPAIPQSWNRYSYAINNPVKYVDPDGNDWTLFIRDSSGGGTTNFGHVALRVHGPGYDYTYDYGRYGATERLLWGEGMLRIWNSWGKFLEGQASHGRGNTLTWQTSKRDDLAMIGHFAALAGAGRQVSSASKYSQFFVQYLLSGEYGRYGILGPNCTTVSMDALSKVASAMALQLEIFAFLNSISPEGLLDDIRTATTPGPRWNFMNENGIIPTDGGTVAVYYNGVQIQ